MRTRDMWSATGIIVQETKVAHVADARPNSVETPNPYVTITGCFISKSTLHATKTERKNFNTSAVPPTSWKSLTYAMMTSVQPMA